MPPMGKKERKVKREIMTSLWGGGKNERDHEDGGVIGHQSNKTFQFSSSFGAGEKQQRKEKRGSFLKAGH